MTQSNFTTFVLHKVITQIDNKKLIYKLMIVIYETKYGIKVITQCDDKK